MTENKINFIRNLLEINFVDYAKKKKLPSHLIFILGKAAVKELKNQGSSALSTAISEHKFTGKSGEWRSMPSLINGTLHEIVLIGGGDSEIASGGAAFAAGNCCKAKKILIINQGIVSDSGKILLSKTKTKPADIAFGARLRSYSFDKYFTTKLETRKPILASVDIHLASNEIKAADQTFADHEIVADGVFRVRDLVSEPSNVLYPEAYSKLCHDILTPIGVKVEILGRKEMARLGMNTLLGVAQGSVFEAQLVVMTYSGGKKGEKPVALVGKGVTFDTGGISIKPSNGMEDMKTDMGGSAVVVATIEAMARAKAKVNLVGVIGVVENMPSGTAQRPGDVVKSMSGQTVEILNTDAEGRLVLADALYYTATKFQPAVMIDLATLTGAIGVALGEFYAGLFANDDKLAEALTKAGIVTGEKVWRMPMSDEFDRMIDSDIADMKNISGTGRAGAITAAQFLKRFINDTKWAHLDIAAVSWSGKGDSLATKGATGFGVRLLTEFITNNFIK